MMKRRKKSTIFKLMILITGLFLAFTVMGCIDPVATECQEKHLKLGEIAKQQLQYGLSSYTLTTQQGNTYHPVQ
jgi:lipopolysaccharide export LptBFGC system permease protein LptF